MTKDTVWSKEKKQSINMMYHFYVPNTWAYTFLKEMLPKLMLHTDATH